MSYITYVGFKGENIADFYFNTYKHFDSGLFTEAETFLQLSKNSYQYKFGCKI